MQGRMMRPETCKKKKYKSAFLEGLFSMLQNGEFSHIICWSEDGASFEIKDTKEFANVVAPKYYKHNNLNSFLKQINMYKFKRSRVAKNVLNFSHPLFKRDGQDLIKSIERKYVAPPRQSQENSETSSRSEYEGKTKKLVKPSNETESSMHRQICKLEAVDLKKEEVPIEISKTTSQTLSLQDNFEVQKDFLHLNLPNLRPINPWAHCVTLSL